MSNPEAPLPDEQVFESESAGKSQKRQEKDNTAGSDLESAKEVFLSQRD
jgi:hypothetical protein